MNRTTKSGFQDFWVLFINRGKRWKVLTINQHGQTISMAMLGSQQHCWSCWSFVPLPVKSSSSSVRAMGSVPFCDCTQVGRAQKCLDSHQLIWTICLFFPKMLFPASADCPMFHVRTWIYIYIYTYYIHICFLHLIGALGYPGFPPTTTDDRQVCTQETREKEQTSLEMERQQAARSLCELTDLTLGGYIYIYIHTHINIQ